MGISNSKVKLSSSKMNIVFHSVLTSINPLKESNLTTLFPIFFEKYYDPMIFTDDLREEWLSIS